MMRARTGDSTRAAPRRVATHVNRGRGRLRDHRKANTMNPHTQALVHSLIASQLHIPDESIEDTGTFDALGLDLLDLLFVVLRLEKFDSGKGDFPVASLDDARTVGDLVALVDGWLHRSATRPANTSDPAECAIAHPEHHQ